MLRLARLASVMCVILISSVFASACDDPTETREPPYAPYKPKTEPLQLTKFQKSKFINKGELTELYWFIVETNQGLQELVSNLEQTKDKDFNEFTKFQGDFRDMSWRWSRMIELRRERIKLNPAELPGDHPRRKIDRTLYYLHEMIKDYGNHYFTKRPLHPEFKQRFEELLEEAKAGIDQMEEE